MYEYVDATFGKIIVDPNKRVKHIIVRRKAGYIQVSVPYTFNPENIPSVLNTLKPKIQKIKAPEHIILTENDILQTFSFKASIVRSHLIDSLRLSLKDEQLVLFVPDQCVLSSPEGQTAIKEAIIRILRLEAKRILPQKTEYFARKFHLTYHQVRINKSKTRWGSCSGKKNINFSLFLLLLPEMYIDYVVLHELAHTVEMNHGERFWKLLDKLCGGNAKALSKEVRKFRSKSHSFLTQE